MQGANMALPDSTEVASLLSAAKANALGHGSIAVRDRRLITALLVLSTVLGLAAGSTGLTDLLSKKWISVIALAAGISTALVILAFTTLKPERHVGAQAEYEDIYLHTLPCNVDTDAGILLYEDNYAKFLRIANEMNTGGTSLTRGQVKKFERVAIKELPKEWRSFVDD
jgi:hypothetical protein